MMLFLAAALSGSRALAGDASIAVDGPPAAIADPLGKGHLWLRAGRIDLRDSVGTEWGLDRERFIALEGYGRSGGRKYLGGEIGTFGSDEATRNDGTMLKDLHLRWIALNAKWAFPVGHGLSFDAGLGGMGFYIAGDEVRLEAGEEIRDPLADFGFGLQALGDFSWRVRSLVLGLDARFQYIGDFFEIDYSNFNVGAHLGVAF